MNKKIISPIIRGVCVSIIGISLAFFSFLAIATIFDGFIKKEKIPYLFGDYTPYRELLIVGICIVFFVLMLLFNIRIKRKWLPLAVDIIVVIALCNPLTFIIGFFGIPSHVHYYKIDNEADFNRCADDMNIDFSNFPEYHKFDEQNVRFVGKVSVDFFFYQSITAIAKYDSIEQCEADYEAYIDSHQFLTEPVIDNDGHCLISAPEFYHEGIFFKVITEGEEDDFPHEIYMIGIDRENSTLYYLYLDDRDLDCITSEMSEHIEEQYNLGK